MKTDNQSTYNQNNKNLIVYTCIKGAMLLIILYAIIFM